MARTRTNTNSSGPDLSKHKFGKSVDADLRLLLSEGQRQLQRFDADAVERAFRFCVDAHKNDNRASGEPYYTHPLQVALIVIQEIPLDDVSVMGALLHDVVEDTSFSLKDIEEEFGRDVAGIVDGATKIDDVFNSREITQAENYRKLLLSLVNDVRVILIKFADRLHNMRTINALSEERQKRMSRETMELYAPFAHRFGLGNIKWELEDLSFKVLNPDAYDNIKKQLNTSREDRNNFIRVFSEPIQERLTTHGLTFEINGRPKHLYSIYKKMIAQGTTIDELYDLFAVRIILDTEDNNDCFLAYGIVSEIYRPVPERFKNYISMPKKNGYRSLHTTVISIDGKRVEVQIRTREMHDFAERGVAAHFRYKAESGGTASWIDSSDLEEWATWVRDVFDSAGDEAAEQLLESFKLNLYQDEIYVFTPKGDLRILPKGATPIDFAFDIHSQVGAHCIGAKVNGKIVPLDHHLITGDQVEILTSRNQTPHTDWVKIAVTHKARTHIRRILNEERRTTAREGKEQWEKRAKKAGLTINDDDLAKCLKTLKYESSQDFFLAIGSGSLEASEAISSIRDIMSPQTKPPTEESPEGITFKSFSNTARKNANGVQIVGGQGSMSKVMFSYARCCNPVPGDDILGIVTIGSGIKVHRKSCHNVHQLQEKLKPRIIDLKWSSQWQGEFLAAVKITGDDRAGMLNDITNAVISVENTNIRGVNIDAFDSLFEGILTVYVTDTDHLGLIFEKLKKIKGVDTVGRFEG